MKTSSPSMSCRIGWFGPSRRLIGFHLRNSRVSRDLRSGIMRLVQGHGCLVQWGHSTLYSVDDAWLLHVGWFRSRLHTCLGIDSYCTANNTKYPFINLITAHHVPRDSMDWTASSLRLAHKIAYTLLATRTTSHNRNTLFIYDV
jgi:hypothetical protein